MKHDIFLNIKTKIEQAKLPLTVILKKIPGTIKNLVTEIEKELSKIINKKKTKELLIPIESYEKIKQNLTGIKNIASIIQNIQTDKKKKNEIKTIEKENTLLAENKEILREITDEVKIKNKEIKREKDLIKEEKIELEKLEKVFDNFIFLLDIISLKLFFVGLSLTNIGNTFLNYSRSIFHFIASIINNTEELLLIQRRLTSLFSNLDKDILQGERSLDTLNRMAIKTVYGTTELAEAFTQFKAMGLENQKIFELTIDTATAFGLQVSRIADDVARALEGDATAFKNLRHSIGLTNQNILKFGGILDKSGKLVLSNSEALEKNRQAVIKYMEQYKGIAEQTVGTLPQQIKNLKDALILLQKEFVKSIQFIGDLAQNIAVLLLKFKDMNEFLKITITTISTLGSILAAIALIIAGIGTKSIGNFLILLSSLGTSLSLILTSILYLYRNLSLLKDLQLASTKIINELVKAGIITVETGKNLSYFISNFKDFLIKGIKILTNFRLLASTLLAFASKIFFWVMRTIGIYFILINLIFILHNYLKSIQESHKKIGMYIEEETRKYLELIAKIKGISKEKIILIGLAQEFTNRNKEVINLLNIYDDKLEYTKELYEETSFEAEKLLNLFLKTNKALKSINQNLTIENIEDFRSNIKTLLLQTVDLDIIKSRNNFFEKFSENFFGDSKKLEKELAKINEEIALFIQDLNIKTQGSSQELIQNLEENRIKVIQKLKEIEKQNIEEIMKIRKKTEKENKLKELEEEKKYLQEKIATTEKLLQERQKELEISLQIQPTRIEELFKLREKIQFLTSDIRILQRDLEIYNQMLKNTEKDITETTKQIEKINTEINNYQKKIQLHTNEVNKLFEKSKKEIIEQEKEYLTTLEKIQRNITSYILKDLTTKSQKEIKEFITNTKKDLMTIKEVNIAEDIEKVKKTLEEINKTRQKLVDIEEKIKKTTNITEQNNLLIEYNNLLYKENELIKEQETLYKNITDKTQELIDSLKEIYRIQSLLTKLKFIGIEDKEIDRNIRKNIDKLLQQIDKLKEIEITSFIETIDLSNIKQINRERIEEILSFKEAKELKQALKDLIRTEITINEIIDRFQTRIQELKPAQIFQEVNLLIKDTGKYLYNNLYFTQEEIKLIQKVVGLENLRVKLLEQINTKELKIKEAEEILEELNKELNKDSLDKFKLKELELNYTQKIQDALTSLPYLADIYKRKIQDIIKEKQEEIKQVEEEIEEYKELARLLENIKISEKEISKLKIDLTKLSKAREEIKKGETEEKRIIFFSKSILEDIYQEALERSKEIISKEVKNINQARNIEADIIRSLKELAKKGIKFSKEDIYNFWKEGRRIYKEFLLELKSRIDDLKKEIEEVLTEEETEKIPSELRKFYDIAMKAIELGKQAGSENLLRLGERLKRSITQQTSFTTSLKEGEEVFNSLGKNEKSYQISLTRSIQQEINKLNTQIEENIKKASEDFLKSTEMFTRSVDKFDQVVQFFTNNLKTVTPKPTHTNTNWIIKQLLTP
ncbi:MAG: hypothetical protein QXR71_04460 [Candidatus Aenigmatarchaeota archaeon]